jgi:hypothetical protein
LLGQRSHRPDAVLRMAHLHTDMERLDVHVALEVCEIVIESATLVNWPHSKIATIHNFIMIDQNSS